jgi:hypothetical protein
MAASQGQGAVVAVAKEDLGEFAVVVAAHLALLTAR